MENLEVKLDIINTLPNSFLTIDPRDVYTILPNPTIIELKSDIQKPPLFIATLLHGNETTGFYALQRLLKHYSSDGRQLPRDLIILIGNVHAAAQFQRRLDGQVDYNRIWAGGSLPEHELSRQALAYIRSKKPFAGIDIHNNTGHNPFYSCVNKLDNPSINLAKLFSNQIVYFTRPHQALTVALNTFTTAVTLESGRSGEIAGIERVFHYIDKVLNLPDVDDEQPSDNDVNMFHSIARIRLPEHATVAFDKQPQSNYDFTFIETIESLNFVELPENTCIGWCQDHVKLQVTNELGEDVSNDIFRYNNGEIRVKRPIIPSMFCTSVKIIRQDCFGYVMQRYAID